MTFGVKKTIEPNEVSYKLADKTYLNTGISKDKINNDFVTLEKLCNIFANRLALHKEIAGKKFTCYIEKKAYDAFVRFAEEHYQKTKKATGTGHEATGIIAGYYLHDKDNPDSKFIVGTNFLEATGKTTPVTCELSYQDSISHSDFCDEHNFLQVIWIHSHPYFEVFYSPTDDTTLKTIYAAEHQTGVVANLKGGVKGYKMYDDKKREEDVFLLDLDKSSADYLEVCLLNKRKEENHKPTTIINDDFKKKEETTEVKKLEKKEESLENENIVLEELAEKIKKEKKAVETEIENLKNEIETLKTDIKIQRPSPNVIIWTFSVFFVLFIVGCITIFVNFKRIDDLEKSIVELQEKVVSQLDSIKNSIAAIPTITDTIKTESSEIALKNTGIQQNSESKTQTLDSE